MSEMGTKLFSLSPAKDIPLPAEDSDIREPDTAADTGILTAKETAVLLSPASLVPTTLPGTRQALIKCL